MAINTATHIDDLSADQYDFATVRDLAFADIEMPDDFEAHIHVLEAGADETLCSDSVGCRSVQDLDADQFDDRDYDARGWVQGRDDVCPACAEAFLTATEGDD